ncbi:MAG: dihydropteroate synthase [Bacteroidia bacterium]|nr:dihydropteroate synthase [Bacteroidia bacterium]MBT8268956.1 dihydropteroate synthase [Bacteroidia bacterium]NNF82652.1 dihydropteroate synthase [Flavobacteriaceae bacterium]NNK69247.1 dihydropteroate synthase [Flavobacteriaceae bacterium]
MTLNCKGRLIDLSTPKVMGILNLTPDSFFDGGRYNDEAKILSQVEIMLKDGATFIDVGGYSSRPGAADVSEDEELKRVVPVIELILKYFPDCLISVDSFRSEVARLAVESGAAMVNDISAGQLDENMMAAVGQLGVPYIMMHMRGTPQSMQSETDYENLLEDVIFYFSERLKKAREHKIIDAIIDPGFGFSKTLDQNYKLMAKLELLAEIGRPILVGISRKSMIYKLLNTDAEHALNGSTALHTIALSKGANILRAHDVKEAIQTVNIFNKLNE